jgi:hypothetical protein
LFFVVFTVPSAEQGIGRKIWAQAKTRTRTRSQHLIKLQSLAVLQTSMCALHLGKCPKAILIVRKKVKINDLPHHDKDITYLDGMHKQ